ncbi:hypothetical protein UFOVP1175_25 [uncultured Caudovirales phage]|jgi:hypothetical protein|uniref:Uncharacterized protein n=1 Tax=uncultured Caudovirales phage TaxID=2100421 RepID=A0A6J5R1C0_9CAUD|nr:hypothetical protein UFOVP1175_25 [uncultured Caudovirales phage]
MTIGELWDALQNYPDDTEVYVGFINGHSIDEEEFTIAEISNMRGKITIAFMMDDINIINN